MRAQGLKAPTVKEVSKVIGISKYMQGKARDNVANFDDAEHTAKVSFFCWENH